MGKQDTLCVLRLIWRRTAGNSMQMSFLLENDTFLCQITLFGLTDSIYRWNAATHHVPIDFFYFIFIYLFCRYWSSRKIDSSSWRTHDWILFSICCRERNEFHSLQSRSDRLSLTAQPKSNVGSSIEFNIFVSIFVALSSREILLWRRWWCRSACWNMQPCSRHTHTERASTLKAFADTNMQCRLCEWVLSPVGSASTSLRTLHCVVCRALTSSTAATAHVRPDFICMAVIRSHRQMNFIRIRIRYPSTKR